MSWTAHQRAMLEEMGIRMWLAPASITADAPDVVELAEPPMARIDALVARAVAQADGRQVDDRARDVADADGARPFEARPLRRVEPVANDRRGSAPLAAAHGAVESMEWPQLEAAVAGCRACGLCEGRHNTVFGVGHHQARWMLVGEAPGEQEDREGEPFVGKAGQLLDNMLRAAGLTRADDSAERQVYIANVLKCRPPQNRNPLPEEVARCEPFLRRQVALVQPQVIVAMGRFAVQSLLASQEPIGRLRGKVHHYLGVPVVVTYHPAYLLRNPLDKSRSWEDLCLAHEVLRSRAPA
jgi:DNA polymerase